MPSVSGPEHRAMEAAAHGVSTLGIPKKVGEEFARADKGKTFDQATLAPNAAVPAGIIRASKPAKDMKPTDWSGLVRGLLKFLAEESREPEHAEGRKIASDSACVIAMDRDTIREKTRDGRLTVEKVNVTKANVCPYRGNEIPGWEELGLDPNQVYNLLRDPEEIAKAAPSLNGVQLLIKHMPVSATDPHQDKTVGSLGTDAEWDGEYLTNSLFVNTQDAIDGIESGKQRELSAGYHYKPDMTPGIFGGKRYDGVMRDIVFNHVALVEDGRVGADCAA